MNIKEKDFKYMTRCIMRDLASMLVEHHKLNLKDALATLYHSDTYKALLNPATGLFYQSPKYVYRHLDNEISTGKM